MNKQRKNPLWKVILTDAAGLGCLILVPILGPLPGPGGIPLLLSGFGLLAINHDWADKYIHYITVHSESLEKLIFPNIRWVKIAWDLFAVLLLVGGVIINIQSEWWILSAFSYAVMASSTTLFMLNRGRLKKFDKLLRRKGKK